MIIMTIDIIIICMGNFNIGNKVAHIGNLLPIITFIISNKVAHVLLGHKYW